MAVNNTTIAQCLNAPVGLLHVESVCDVFTDLQATFCFTLQRDDAQHALINNNMNIQNAIGEFSYLLLSMICRLVYLQTIVGRLIKYGMWHFDTEHKLSK